MFYGRKLIYLLGIFLFIILCSAFQTVFWFQILGHLAPPLLWLSVINYVILARQAPYSLFFVYLLVIAASSFSATSVGILLLVMFIYYFMLVVFKNNFYIESTSYFVLINFGGAFAFHLLYFLCSNIIESDSTPLLILDRITQVLLTPIFSIPVYGLLKKWEKGMRAPEIFMDTARYESE